MSVFAVPASSLPSYLSPADPSKAVPPLPPPPPYASPTSPSLVTEARLCSSVSSLPDPSPLLTADPATGAMRPNEDVAPGVLNCCVRYKDRVDPDPERVVLRLKSGERGGGRGSFFGVER